MNILITGGAGFIGSTIARNYINEGHNVVIIDDLWSGREQNIPCLLYTSPSPRD